MTILYGEAVQEAERLKKVAGQHFEVVRESCPCDYDRMCGKCAGEGTYYDLEERCVALVRFDPRFHKFDWTTVADLAQTALMLQCAALGKQTERTLAEVRRATRVVSEIKSALEAA